MPGALPEITTAGAVVYRDSAGNPTSPPEVHNAYSPLPAFKSTCDLTALPSNCDARIEAKQINAIVSELLALAECFNPNGTWDCTKLNNLCTAFTAWVDYWLCPIHVGDQPPSTPCPNQLWWETDSGVLWIWYDDGNTQQWVQTNAGGGKIASNIHVGDNPPASPVENDLWWESDTGTLYIYYNDGNSTQWIQTSGGGASATVVMDQLSIVGAGDAVSPYRVDLVDCGTY